MPRSGSSGGPRRALVVVVVALAAVVTALAAPSAISALSASAPETSIDTAGGGADTASSLRDQAGAESAASLRDQVRDGTLDRSHGLLKTCGLCRSRMVAAAPGAASALSTDKPVGWGADDLATALHLPAQDPGHDRHGAVAVITGGAYPVEESDLAAYRAQYGLPACTVANGCLTITGFDGGPAPEPTNARYDQGAAMEAALDVDMASASCPSCRIIDVKIPAEDGIPGPVEKMHKTMGDIAQAVDTAIALGADAVSMSLGLPNDNSPEAQALGRRLIHPGVAIVAASGDTGWELTDKIGWPANLPWVTAAGGVNLTRQGNAFTQSAWPYAGSGCDTNQPAASGAPETAKAACGGHRAAADVSAVAENVAFYITYTPLASQHPPHWTIGDGTSLSSPFIAGLYARGGHTTGVRGPNTIYSAPGGAFTDITTGKNVNSDEGQASCPADAPALCEAGPGWDGPTGVGTPNGLSGF
ncbi:S8 family serine peptidase [Amycolatopsis pigmentata]|uniref:S8 family serine peptidase n=1 Tax=Amycolatopsis pigmentata TaxID=450801 RepID=A0ABW5FWR6_9PSEU